MGGGGGGGQPKTGRRDTRGFPFSRQRTETSKQYAAPLKLAISSFFGPGAHFWVGLLLLHDAKEL